MSKSIVAKRYANAIFQIAKENNLIEKFEEELSVLKEVVSTDSNLVTFFGQPNVEIAKKKDFVQTVFSSFSTQILNMLFILIERHRENEIVEIVNYFIELANKERNIADATVYSVRALSDEEQTAVATKFAKIENKDAIRVHNVIDSALLGGIKVRIGNRVYDGSLQGKVSRMKRALTAK